MIEVLYLSLYQVNTRVWLNSLSKTLGRPGASHQTGWTGLVAKTIQLYGLLDPQQALEVGKEAGFVKGVSEAKEAKT